MNAERGARKQTNHESRVTNHGLRVLVAAFCFTLAATSARADDPVSPQVQSAVDRGLAYLAAKQQPSGFFPTNLDRSTAVTSLATMAFLSRGHVPGQGPYGEQVNRAVDAVLSSQQESGLLSFTFGNATMYDHGISTVMLCEVYGMVDETRRNKIEFAVAKAVKLIIDAQRVPKDANDQGGWRYLPTDPTSDISVTGWQLMALRGAANIGAAVPQQTLTDGLAYIRRRAVPSGGFCYTGNEGPNPARTGTGILSMELLGQHESPEALAGGDFLLQNPLGRPAGSQHYSYAIYYCAQAANQLGGKYWDGIYKPIRDALVASQHPDGSWPGIDDPTGSNVYATSMAVLVLTVPYHYLPLYQK